MKVRDPKLAGWQQRNRDLEEDVAILRLALKRYANRACWEPVEGHYVWFPTTDEHPAVTAEEALKETWRDD